MVNELNGLTQTMSKSMIDGLLIGFNLFFSVVKSLPWQLNLLVSLGIFLNLVMPKRKKRFGYRW